MTNIVNFEVNSMSSREIADLTGKRHDNVKRDIKKMFSDLDLDALSFEDTYKDASNRDQTEYKLNKHYTLVLVTGYSAKLRDTVISRWQYLEDMVRILKDREASKKNQLEAMEALQGMLPEGFKKEKASYIKANTVVNKAISNYFGFPKMLKKDEMNPDMIQARDKCLDDYLKLFDVLEDNGQVKEVLYNKYKQKQLT